RRNLPPHALYARPSGANAPRRQTGWLAEGGGFEPPAQGSAPRTAFPVPHLRPLGHPSRSEKLAEGRGFEPPRDLLGPYPISSRTPSTGLGHPSAYFCRMTLPLYTMGHGYCPSLQHALKPQPTPCPPRRPVAAPICCRPQSHWACVPNGPWVAADKAWPGY